MEVKALGPDCQVQMLGMRSLALAHDLEKVSEPLRTSCLIQ